MSGRARAGRVAGQGLVEFGLILGLCVAVAVVTLVFFSPQLAFMLSVIGRGIDQTS